MVISRLGRVGMGAWGRGQDLVSANHRSHLIECLGCPGAGGGERSKVLQTRRQSLTCAGDLGLASLGYKRSLKQQLCTPEDRFLHCKVLDIHSQGVSLRTSRWFPTSDENHHQGADVTRLDQVGVGRGQGELVSLST